MSAPRPHIFFRDAARPARGFRSVDRFKIHGGAVAFRTLIDELIPPDTRYVVFDLDRTFHLERNVGEFLGWDLVAREAWGRKFHHLVASQTVPSKFVFDPSDLAGNLRYLATGARTWAIPGLIYGLWMKLVYANRRLQRFAFLYFGSEPVKAVQQIPQGALLHQMSRYGLDELRLWATSLLHRLAPDMVIPLEDIAAIRARSPEARIIISSASPQPVLEAAAEYFGVDDVIYSELETLDDAISSPPWLHWFLRRERIPQRIAPYGSLRINNSHSKVERLLERYPEFTEGRSVGISDTDKGDDHAWTSLFTHLVDVNSRDPFPPIVPQGSPVESIDSVSLLSQHEISRREQGDPDYLDERRKNHVAERTQLYRGGTLFVRLHRDIERANALESEGYTVRARIRDAIETAWTDTSAAIDRFNDAVRDYNIAEIGQRASHLDALKATWTSLQTAQRQMARMQRPFADKYQALQQLLRESRASFDCVR